MKDDLSFVDVMNNLQNEELISIPLLYHLSDLQGEDLALFTEKWVHFSDNQRRVIVRHLADLLEDNFVVQFDTVFTLALQDSYAPVRLAALDGLWLSENPRLIQPIITIMNQDNTVEVQAAAAAVLGQFLLNAVCEIIPAKYEHIILPALLTHIQDDNTPNLLRQRALEAASQSGDSILHQHIALAYEHEDLEMQISAIRAMGSMGQERWLSTILEELNNEHEEMRLAAANAAGELNDEKAISPLSELLQDESHAVQIAAVYALSAIGGDLVEEILEEILSDPEQEHLHEIIEEAFDDMTMFSTDLQDYLSLGGMIDPNNLPPHMLSGWEN